MTAPVEMLRSEDGAAQEQWQEQPQLHNIDLVCLFLWSETCERSEGLTMLGIYVMTT